MRPVRASFVRRDRRRNARPRRVPLDWGEWLSVELIEGIDIEPDGSGTLGSNIFSLDNWLELKL